jgi:site-specific DNA recombinase
VGQRPQAGALVAQPADPERGWDAIVIGEYERAFYGNQYASMAPLFEHYGVSLWVPEVGGRVDWHAEDHEQTMVALGLSSKREITRTRIRVRTAMAAQTLRTVAAILANPRYTGRQVWNRQPSQAVLVDPANTTLGHKQVQRWNLPEGWGHRACLMICVRGCR